MKFELTLLERLVNLSDVRQAISKSSSAAVVSSIMMIMSGSAQAQSSTITLRVFGPPGCSNCTALGTLTYTETQRGYRHFSCPPDGYFSEPMYADTSFSSSLGTITNSNAVVDEIPYCGPNESVVYRQSPYDPLVLNLNNGCTINFGTSGPPYLATCPQVTGYINPKYVIVGVTYAPPGPLSYVSYQNSTLVGNTTSTNNTFTNGTNLTVSVSSGISAWGVTGAVTNTESTEYTQTSTASNETTISKQTTVTDITKGTGDAFHPVNHDFDTIWLWLNPLFIYTVDAYGNLIWNGYGYDSHDPSGSGGLDVFPVLVGVLNGHFGPDPSVQQVLSRTWVTSYEPSITWPSGEGPGLTSADIAQILQADPFTSGYTLPSSLPPTSSDGRFTQLPYPPNPIPYTQAGPGNGGGETRMYSAVNVDSHVVGIGTSTSFKQTFGRDSSLSANFWLTFSSKVTETQTLQWTQGWMSKLTTTTTLTDAFSITGPPCSASLPCVPTYAGPGQFIAYQDNQYGTFMFYPSN
jgi:hypothetical protein